jgi:hypothetical protein
MRVLNRVTRKSGLPSWSGALQQAFFDKGFKLADFEVVD